MKLTVETICDVCGVAFKAGFDPNDKRFKMHTDEACGCFQAAMDDVDIFAEDVDAQFDPVRAITLERHNQIACLLEEVVAEVMEAARERN